jgi:hypothetical protein
VAAFLVGAKFDGLTNSYMTPEQRAELDLTSREHYNRVWGSKIQVIGWSFYAAILWGLKVCITAVYGRLTCVHHELEEVQILHCHRSPLTSCMQEWNQPSRAPRTTGIRHTRCHVLGCRSHNPLFLPTFPPLLAGEP